MESAPPFLIAMRSQPPEKTLTISGTNRFKSSWQYLPTTRPFDPILAHLGTEGGVVKHGSAVGCVFNGRPDHTFGLVKAGSTRCVAVNRQVPPTGNFRLT